MLEIPTAETILYEHLGHPTKTPTKYIIGFKTGSGKLLAMHRTLGDVRIWFEPPAPPPMGGMHLLTARANKNSNFNSDLERLRAEDSLRCQITSAPALISFLNWYSR